MDRQTPDGIQSSESLPHQWTVLAYADLSHLVKLEIDASLQGLGSVLSQKG